MALGGSAPASSTTTMRIVARPHVFQFLQCEGPGTKPAKVLDINNLLRDYKEGDKVKCTIDWTDTNRPVLMAIEPSAK